MTRPRKRKRKRPVSWKGPRCDACGDPSIGVRHGYEVCRDCARLSTHKLVSAVAEWWRITQAASA